MSQAMFDARLDPEVEAQLLQLARETGRSAGSLFNEAVREYLEREMQQAEDITASLHELEAEDIASPEEVDALFARITTPEQLQRARDEVARETW